MQQLTFGDLIVTIIRKKIKNLYLRVYAGSGKVALSAPIKTDEKNLIEFIQSKIAWIQQRLQNPTLHVPPKRVRYESGEKHFYLGNTYELYLSTPYLPRKTGVYAEYIHLYAEKNAVIARRALLLNRWYRKRLLAIAAQLIAHWQPIINVHVNTFHVKKMKTKWGTCNIDKKRIWLNLELIKKPLPCIEYVVIHEMVHLLERYHNKRFHGFMDQFCPNWREIKKQLNEFGLG